MGVEKMDRKIYVIKDYDEIKNIVALTFEQYNAICWFIANSDTCYSISELDDEIAEP